MTEFKIEIKTNPVIRPLRVMISSICVLVVIGTGIVTGSSAMQWAGFVMLLLTMIAYMAVKSQENKGLSIADARKRLDEIETEEV